MVGPAECRGQWLLVIAVPKVWGYITGHFGQ